MPLYYIIMKPTKIEILKERKWNKHFFNLFINWQYFTEHFAICQFLGDKEEHSAPAPALQVKDTVQPAR